MCDHINDGVLQFEIKQKRGQSPTYICKVCNEEFNQTDAHAIIEELL